MRLPNPQIKLWNQSNNNGPVRVESGRTLSSMFGSFGIDQLFKLGRVGLRGTILTTKTADDADFSDAPQGFKYFAGAIWTISGSYLFKNSGVVNGNFVQDTATGTPTNLNDNSDLELFFDRTSNTTTLYVTGGTDTVYYTTDGSTFSNFDMGLGSGNEACLTFYANRMYMQAGNNYIISWNAARTVASPGAANTIRLPAGERLSFMKAASNRIWVGTINEYNEFAHIYEWDGASPLFSRQYTIEAVGANSCVIKNDVPHVMDSRGRLLRWNNSTFVEIGRLPVADKYLFLATAAGSPFRYVHRNGMAIYNNKIVVNIGNRIEDNGDTIEEFCPGGVWEYDDFVGFYHKYALSYTGTNLTITDFGQNRIAYPGALGSINVLNDSSNAQGLLLIGAKYYTNASSTAAGIWIDNTVDTKTNTGYIVTSELDASGVADTWQKAFLKFRRLLNSTDKIILKYRFTKQAPTVMSITWVNTTSFTTADANMANYAVGDEVEIVAGTGGGMCSHITAISLNAGTYTVTVDETHTGCTTGTAQARFQKWIKAGAVESDTTSDWKEFSLGKIGTVASNSGWVQFKIFFYWKGENEFDYIDSVNVPYKKAE